MTTRNIIDYAAADDAVEMRKELYADIHDRISAHLDTYKQQVAQNLITPEDQSEDQSDLEDTKS
jgi:hypothetical protein